MRNNAYSTRTVIIPILRVWCGKMATMCRIWLLLAAIWPDLGGIMAKISVFSGKMSQFPSILTLNAQKVTDF